MLGSGKSSSNRCWYTQPILFKASKNIPGSTVSKNSVRSSNRGCIVLAKTSDVLVQDNIAHDTRGHCFVLKEGTETGNIIRRNLGAKTTRPGGTEGDDEPSTFWISNSNNTIEHNVAAGSQGDGFQLVFDHVSPTFKFRGNRAHSNSVVSLPPSVLSGFN